MNKKHLKKPLVQAGLIAVVYSFGGALWIIFSDQLFAFFAAHFEDYIFWQNIKGLCFIFVTAFLLFVIVYYLLNRLDKNRQQVELRQQRLKNLLSNIPGMAYRCLRDENWTMKFVSEWSEELLGYQPEELIDNKEVSYGELIHPDDRKAVQEQIKAAVEYSRPFQMEYRVRTKEGKEKWVRERGRALDKNGENEIIEGIIESISDVKAAEKTAEVAREEAEFMARYDHLTGLPGRGYFFEQVTEILEEEPPGETENKYSLLVVDLIDFGQINDFHGYWAGNKVLQVCARWLQSNAPDEAITGRLGGDKFGIFMDMSEIDDKSAELHSIFKPLEHEVSLEEEEVVFSLKIGLAVYPEHGETLEDLLAAANRALSRGKMDINSSGIYLYETEDTEKLAERMQSVDQVMQALEDDRLEVHYQPIIDYRDGSVLMNEALLRLNTPTGEMHTLDDYGEVAYENRLTSKIDYWVIEQVLDETHEFLGSSAFPLVSLNLFPTSVLQGDFFNNLDRRIKKADFPKDKLVIEVTEKLLSSHSEQAVDNLLKAVKEHGYRIALDDFGVGHGSFDILKQLPIDYLKIDGTFILELAKNEIDQNFVRTIADLCGDIEVEVIGEWIENEQVAEKLVELGVFYQQGYHYCWPKPIEELLEVLNNGEYPRG
ncbi:MAG: EAL domain-containing protein [bacterium]